MVVTCEKCKLQYNDVYHWTYCPHDRFEMRTIVVGPDGKVKGVARTVEQLYRMQAE